jgi:hypothetical protein
METPDKTEPSMESEQQSPLDEAISQVDSYIKDIKMVTPETLTDLRDKLMAIQADVEGEETPEGESMSGQMMKGGQ